MIGHARRMKRGGGVKSYRECVRRGRRTVYMKERRGEESRDECILRVNSLSL